MVNREINQPEETENREVNQPEEYRTRYDRRVSRTQRWIESREQETSRQRTAMNCMTEVKSH